MDEERSKNPMQESLSEDLLWGINAIADEIGRTPRQTFHMAHNGQLPTMKCGGRIVASRAALRRHFMPENKRSA
jgi:hypothetical protein